MSFLHATAATNVADCVDRYTCQANFAQPAMRSLVHLCVSHLHTVQLSSSPRSAVKDNNFVGSYLGMYAQ